MTLTPYILFNGNCEEALNFYAKAFNGTIKDLKRFEGSPAEGMSADKQKVMHANLEADGLFLMASDGGKGQGGMVQLSVNVEDGEELNRVFTAMSEGAQVTMPLQDTFWGARFGMLTDKYGVSWMFNHELKKEKGS
jgi:PhnB protein